MRSFRSRQAREFLSRAIAHDDAMSFAHAQHAAQRFEVYFIAHMLRQMGRNARDISGGNTHSQKDADDMLVSADRLLADALAGEHASRIADVILEQLMAKGRRPDGQDSGSGE